MYHTLRPRAAVGHETPASRWYLRERPRPARLPPVRYPAGRATWQNLPRGAIRWHGDALLVGGGRTGEHVGVREQGAAVVVAYGTRVRRRIRRDHLQRGRIR